jgi:hypothetical protein
MVAWVGDHGCSAKVHAWATAVAQELQQESPDPAL